jgi:hypothetical protein
MTSGVLIFLLKKEAAPGSIFAEPVIVLPD